MNQISFYEAIQKITNSNIQPIGDESLFFGNSLDRVLNEDIFAKEDMPLFPISSMDGYAFRIEDLEHFKQNGLEISRDNPAGSDFVELEERKAIKTFTGSLMPKNSDTLVIVESVEAKNNKIYLKENIQPKQGDWVRQRGDNYRSGEMLLSKGCKISPYEIGLLAELNHIFVKVKQKPKVGILVSGSEVIEVGEQREHFGQVRNTNQHILKAMVEKMGGVAVVYKSICDNIDAIREIFSIMLKECDFIVTTGGMSKGDYDFTQKVILEKSEIVFRGVDVKPGKPTTFAIDKNTKKPILGLSGNPNAVAITFYIFGRIIFSKLLQQEKQLHIISAITQEEIKKKDPRIEFRSCFIKLISGKYEVSFMQKKSNQSAIINNLCGDSALAILDRDFIDKNQEIKVILFKEF